MRLPFSRTRRLRPLSRLSWLGCLGALFAAGGGTPPLQGQAIDSISVVRGQLLEHETGIPLDGAAVSLASGPGPTRGIGTRVTNSDGRFMFREVRPGSYRLIVRLIGYQELRDTLEIGPGAEVDLSLSLSVSPIELEPLVVVSDRRPPPGPLRDFERRRESMNGTYFDREEIERRNPFRFSDLLRLVPGARVMPAGPFDNSIRLRSGCRPVIWMDGMRLSTGEGIDHLIQPLDLEAVEIYHASELPVEFGANSCGGIIVWTRRGEPSVGGGSWWKRALFALVFLTVALVATN